MHSVVICASGSRGDCQPYCALGLGLLRAGMKVAVFTNPEHETLVTDLGLSFQSNGIDFKSAFTSDAANRANQNKDFVAFLDVLGALNQKSLKDAAELMIKFLNESKPDICIMGTQHFLDPVWIPHVTSVPCFPLILSRALCYDPSVAPFGLPSLPCSLNRPLWYGIFWKYMHDIRVSLGEDFILKHLGKANMSLFPGPSEFLDLYGVYPGMSGQFKEFLPVAVAMDDHVVGRRKVDPPWIKFIGNLVLPLEVAEGESFGGDSIMAMHEFLKRGLAPVYIGWGSVKCGSAKQMTLLALRALQVSQCRGIVLGGWAELGLCAIDGEEDEAPLRSFCVQNVLFMKTAPHEQLFKHCSVIVHHGGIGTTVASLRSGKPTIVTPILYDQFESAESVSNLGVGFGAPHLMKITPSMLGNYIKSCLSDTKIQARAAEVGALVSKRNGVVDGVSFTKEVLCEVESGGYWMKYNEWKSRKMT